MGSDAVARASLVLRFFAVALEQLFDRHVGFVDFFVAGEFLLRLDLHDEREPVLLRHADVYGEFHGEIPLGVRVAVLVDVHSLLIGVVVVVVEVVIVDRNDGVQVCLGEKIQVLQALGLIQCDIQRLALHS